MLKNVAISLLGGCNFWLPTTIIELVSQREPPLVLGSTVPLVAVVLIYAVLKRLEACVRKRVALLILTGVYILGPLMMSIAAIPRGGKGPLDDPLHLVLASLLPPVTIIMSGYDGTLVALALATFLMIWFHLRFDVSPQTP